MLSQEDRPIKIKTSLGETELVIERFSGFEAVSTPFEFQVDLLSGNPSVDLKALLRTGAAISVRLADGSERHIHGKFNRLVQMGQSKDGLVMYQGTLVPWLWFLSLGSACRIFQNMSVVQIVEQIFTDFGYSDYKLELTGSYQPREYCVQYRESYLNFVSRLLEEEGIFYYFKHTADGHSLVLADATSGLDSCPGQEEVPYASSEGGFVDEDGILSLLREERVHTGNVSLQDYDFEKPSTSLDTHITGEQPEEVYDYPGKYVVRGEGERYARIRLEAEEARYLTVSGTSCCRALVSGHKFTLADHYRDDTNQAYTVISVRHRAGDNNYMAPHGEPFVYRNTFTAIPNSVKYRPECRARRPFVQGSQTAKVVGKSGEEIWCDKYGRVKVQFYWDRDGANDEKSSCWVRVSQIWAGKTWGWVTIPRIGQEVIVDFLEGDPDRPIITGRVYNAEQMPPYALPDNQTQSGIKSRSSKGGAAADFNEIRFEDKKGQELIKIHAQKDMDTSVEHDDKQLVQNDRSIEVDGNHTELIKKNMDITVNKNESETIDGNRTITVKGTHTEEITKDTSITIKTGNHTYIVKQGNDSISIDTGNRNTKIKTGNESLSIDKGNRDTRIKMGNDSTKLDLGKSVTEAMQSIELKVGQSSIKLDQMGVTIKGMMIKIEGQTTVDMKGLLTTVKADAVMTIKGGITMIN